LKLEVFPAVFCLALWHWWCISKNILPEVCQRFCGQGFTSA